MGSARRTALPGIAQREYARRRSDLMALLEPDSIAILPAAPVRSRSRDTEHRYRQDSDFHYLCGFPEPEAVMVLAPGRAHGEFLLFCRDRDPEVELWDGSRIGPDGACRQFGADDAFPIGDIDDILPGLIEGRERVYYSLGKLPEFDSRIMRWVNRIRDHARTGAHPPGELVDLDHQLHELRLFKSPAELRMMRRAADISAAAHVRAMQVCRPGMYEYELEAELNYAWARAGARDPAYTPIVGAGANGCVLHYVDNNARMADGELVLIDAGCELGGYAADITRTFPVSGRFSAAQQAIYEIVLAAQLEAIRAVRPGNHWNEAHDATVRVIVEGLVGIGVLDGEANELIELEAYRPFYMHRAGHWLGLDVHDVGDYRVGGEWRVLEPGMVLTVEPGIYIAPDNHDVAKKWRGIGVRIEDDVAVTARGHEVLSRGVPKSVADIESLMAGGGAA